MITARIGVAASAAALVAVGVLGVAHADDPPEPAPPPPLTAQDQQFLNRIHANGIPGQDDTASGPIKADEQCYQKLLYRICVGHDGRSTPA